MEWILGILFAILSALGNGTFVVPSKLNAVKQLNPNPLVFNAFTCCGIFLSSGPFLLLAPRNATDFSSAVRNLFHLLLSAYGLLGGLLFSVSAACAFSAVHEIGIAVASGVWCGTAIIVSFVFGQLFDKPAEHLLLAAIAVGVLMLSVGGVAFVGHVASESRERSSGQPSEEAVSRGSGQRLQGQEQSIADASCPLLNEDDERAHGCNGREEATLESTDASIFLRGLLLAIAAGTAGGLILAPATFAPDDVKGLCFLPSFGLGVLVSGLSVPFLASCWSQQGGFAWHAMQVGPYGVLAGVIWNLGNMASILAVSRVGYAVAYPIMQCGLFVAGLWGILLFDEIQGKLVGNYLLFGSAIVMGATILSFS